VSLVRVVRMIDRLILDICNLVCNREYWLKPKGYTKYIQEVDREIFRKVRQLRKLLKF
jgi:hypothetical protein